MGASKRNLSSRKIIAAAIEIADEKGLRAVTLRGIANRIGVHVTSLYNHVPTKEAVLEEMVKTLLAEAKLPTGETTWQAWVRQFAQGMRALAANHPGAFEAFHHASAQGERSAESFEAAFAAFRSAGFSDEATYKAVKTTIITVLGLVLEDTARIRKPRMRTDLKHISSSRFPLVHEIHRVANETDTFQFCIETLLAGFESLKRGPEEKISQRG